VQQLHHLLLLAAVDDSSVTLDLLLLCFRLIPSALVPFGLGLEELFEIVTSERGRHEKSLLIVSCLLALYGNQTPLIRMQHLSNIFMTTHMTLIHLRIILILTILYITLTLLPTTSPPLNHPINPQQTFPLNLQLLIPTKNPFSVVLRNNPPHYPVSPACTVSSCH
jgi:hypothetical protein